MLFYPPPGKHYGLDILRLGTGGAVTSNDDDKSFQVKEQMERAPQHL